MRKIFYAVIISGIALGTSCSRELAILDNSAERNTYFIKGEEPTFSSEHDMALNELAKIINSAVRENEGIRSFIHAESLRRFDGDYEFLIERSIDKKVNISDQDITTKACGKDVTFGDVLRYYSIQTKSGEDLLSAIQSQYPDLQVAIPVHAAEWDPETYTPAVVFVPEDYQEYVTEYVSGYDAEGNYIQVDAINAPDVPVIVISHNEGLDESLRIYPDSLVVPFPVLLQPAPPTGLNAEITVSGVLLSWQRSPGVSGYYVWRKGPGETSYTKIADLNGITNVGYQDNTVIASLTYQYYVTAYREDQNNVGLLPIIQESDPSNIVTITVMIPISPLDSFNVATGNSHSVECSWGNNGSPHSDVVIEHMGPNDASYSTLYRETGWGTNYCYQIPVEERGQRHNYRAYRDNGTSLSDAKTDFIFPPYRNTATDSNIYVKKIQYSGWIEGWLQGDAEFDIIATYYDRTTNTVKADSMFVRTSSGANLYSRLLKRWRYFDSQKDWYSLLDIHMLEKDPGSEFSYSLSAKVGVKIQDVISIEASGTYTHQGQQQDNRCGDVTLFYYDNPEEVLVFPNYSVRLTISENDL